MEIVNILNQFARIIRQILWDRKSEEDFSIIIVVDILNFLLNQEFTDVTDIPAEFRSHNNCPPCHLCIAVSNENGKIALGMTESDQEA